MKRLAAFALLLAGCHDWSGTYERCLAEGRCTGTGGSGGSSAAGGGAAATGGGAASTGGGTAGTGGGTASTGGGSGSTGGGSSGALLQWDLAFGDGGITEPGLTVPLGTFTLQNLGGTKVTGVTATVDGGGFTVDVSGGADCRLYPLDNLQTCAAHVTFAPTALGVYDAQLFAADLAGTVSAAIPLHGEARWAPLNVQVTVTGPGEVDVASSALSPSQCSTTCTYQVPRFTPVSLTPTAAMTSFQSAWGGACSTTSVDASCVLTPTDDAGSAASATFLPWPTLTVALLPNILPTSEARVVGFDGGLDCPGTCSLQVPPGAAFRLDETSSRSIPFASWGAGCTADGGTCTGTLANANKTINAVFTVHNRFFVTSSLLPLDAGTRGAYDSHCNVAAHDAGLSGNYAAFMSDPGSAEPGQRFVGFRGWSRPDGRPFINTLDQPLMTVSPNGYPPRLDEYGNDLYADSGVQVAVGGGTMHQCTGWTGAGNFYAGDATRGSPGWQSHGQVNIPCGSPQHIYCAERDFDAGLPQLAVPANARMAYLSTTAPSPNNLTNLDNACPAFSGRSFLAFVATDGGSAISRFKLDAGTWFRPDGVRLIAQATDLLSPGPVRFEAPLQVQPDGTFIASGNQAWTGALSPSTDAGTNDNCAMWTVSSSANQAIVGDCGATGSDWFDSQPLACNSNNTVGQVAVYCFQK